MEIMMTYVSFSGNIANDQLLHWVYMAFTVEYMEQIEEWNDIA